jgi:hypothetical protein
MKALVLVVLAGCVGQSIDDIMIACTADSDCPQDAWCDLRFEATQVCHSLEHSGPPHIAYDGFVVGQQLVPTISVPAKTTSIHTLRLRNDGGSETDVTLDVAAPPCVDAGSLVRSDGELVREGDMLDAEFDVYPAVGCASPATLTFTATASKRAFTFTAMITIMP